MDEHDTLTSTGSITAGWGKRSTAYIRVSGVLTSNSLTFIGNGPGSVSTIEINGPNSSLVTQEGANLGYGAGSVSSV